MTLLPQDSQEKEYWWLGVQIVADFLISITMPVIVFAAIGQWLDKAYNQEYIFTFLGILLAGLITALIIKRKANYYGKKYEVINGNQDDNTNNN